MARFPVSTLAASAGLLGGFATARSTGNRQLGGAVLAAAGAVAACGWRRKAGTPTAAALTVGYLGAFGGSHPLAKKLGAWPSVCAVTGAVAVTSWVVAERQGGCCCRKGDDG